MDSQSPARTCCGCGSARPQATSAPTERKDNTMKFAVPDMSCGHCVSTITKAVKALDANAAVMTDLAAKTVSIETSAPAPAVSKALDEAGYPNTPA